MSMVSTMLQALGFLTLFHSGYSSSHFRTLLVEMGVSGDVIDASSPPVDVKIEVIVGIAITLLGSLMSIGTLEPVLTGGSKGGSKGLPSMPPAYKSRDYDVMGVKITDEDKEAIRQVVKKYE